MSVTEVEAESTFNGVVNSVENYILAIDDNDVGMFADFADKLLSMGSV